jgi:hypothetical protein
MSKANKIYQVLVPSGNQALPAAGATVSSLLPGQIGVFSYQDNLAIDGTPLASGSANAAGLRNFYLAVGRDKDGDGVVDSIDHSSGTHIQNRNVQHYNLRCYTPGQPKIVDITDFTVACDTDYCVKVMLENCDTFAMYGANSPFKTFVVNSGCCEGCTDCPSGDCINLAKSLIKNINTDPDKLFIASAIDYTTTPGTPIVLADDVAIAAFVAANPDKCIGVRLTAVTKTLVNYCCVNLNYCKLVSTNLNVTLGCGFECSGKVTVFQEMVNEETKGSDINQDEYFAGGFSGAGVYRASTLNGTITGAPTYADPKGKYLVIDLEYEQNSESGWGEYMNDQATRIAIPCEDTATRDALITVLDNLLSNKFGTLAQDAAACPACTVINKTSDKAVGLDGLA